MDRKEVLRRAFGFSMSEEGRDKFTDDKRDAGGPTADWPAVERLLNESYAALRRGVGR